MLNYANDRGIRTVKNSSGSAVEQYQILKPNAMVITPTDNASGWNQKQTFDTTTPTADDQFCITQRAIPNGRFGPAIFSGVTPCKIQVSDASHTHAKAGTSTAKLESATSGGAEILWKESGTGEKNAIVRLGNTAASDNKKHVATTQILNDLTLDSTDSGWNLLPDVYFGQVTNENGTGTISGNNFGYSDIFDSRPDVGISHGIRLQEPGTYYGVFAVEVQTNTAVIDSFTVGAVTGSTYTEPDTSNATWIASVSGGSKEIRFMDYVNYDIHLILTDIENTTYNSIYKVAGAEVRQHGGQVNWVDSANRHEMVNIPFFFSVESTDAPIELQPWINIDTASAFASASTNITLKASTEAQKERGWIRYIKDIASYTDVISELGI